MFKFYKIGIATSIALGFIIIIGSVILTIFCRLSNVIFLIAVPCGLMIALFPILLNHRQLTNVLLSESEVVSYSLFGEKLCAVSLGEPVFYSFFYVRPPCEPEIEFIAISNESFICDNDFKSFSKKRFYGSYDRKTIIIFPYDEQVAPLLNIDNWKPNQNKRPQPPKHHTPGRGHNKYGGKWK